MNSAKRASIGTIAAATVTETAEATEIAPTTLARISRTDEIISIVMDPDIEEKLSEEVDKCIEHISEWVSDCHEVSRGDYSKVSASTISLVGYATSRKWTTSSSARAPTNLTTEQIKEIDEIKSVPLADNVFPIGVQPTPKLMMAINDLSKCVAISNSRQQTGYVGKFGGPIMDRIARIPSFIKTLLLIERITDRKQIFNLPLIRLLFLSKECLRKSNHIQRNTLTSNPHHRASLLMGACQKSWLLEMLVCGNKIVAQRAVDYLEYISSVRFVHHVKYYQALNSIQPPKTNNEHDYTIIHNGENTNTATDGRAHNVRLLMQYNCEKIFNSELKALYDEIQNLPYFACLLVVLPIDQLERASVTAVVQWVLQNSVRNPLHVASIFADFIFQLTLLFSFREQLILAYTHTTNSTATEGGNTQVFGIFGALRALSFSCLAFFIIRALDTAITMSIVSPMVFRKYLLDSYAWLDTLCILLALISNIIFVIDSDRENMSRFPINLGSIVLGFLWLRLIGFLQILNHKLATYYFAIMQICRDIVLFVLILIVTIFGFGDMLYVIYSSDEETCHGQEDQSQFCSTPLKSYFAVYQILVGAFDLTDFDKSVLTKLLYVVATGFVVLIMLNILIAIVSESYTVSILRTYKLFGRARTIQIARHYAWASFIFPNDENGVLRDTAFWPSFLFRVIVKSLNIACLFGLFYVSITIGRTIHDSTQHGTAKIIGLALYILLAVNGSVSMVVYVIMHNRRGGVWLKRLAYDNFVFRNIIKRPVMWISLTLLGANKEPTITDLLACNDKWRGRLNHIENVVADSVLESEDTLSTKIVNLQEKIEEMEQKLVDRDTKHEEALRTILESIRSTKGYLTEDKEVSVEC